MTDWKKYEKRVQELEAEGMTTSDAQGIADMEHPAETCPICRAVGGKCLYHAVDRPREP